MKSHKYLSLYVLPLLCVPWAVSALYAAEGDRYTLLDDLNLRQGPGSSYVSTQVVTEGEHVIELGRDGAWIKVRLSTNAEEGWVYGESLALTAADELDIPDDKIVSGEQEQTKSQLKIANIEAIDKQAPLNDLSSNIGAEMDNKISSKKPLLGQPESVSTVELTNEPSMKNTSVDVASQTSAEMVGVLESKPQQGLYQNVLQTTMIRDQASALSEMLGWLGSGAAVQIVDKQGKWTKIRLRKSGREGWIETGALQGGDAGSTIVAKQLAAHSTISAQTDVRQVNIVPASTGQVQPVQNKSIQNQSAVKQTRLDSSPTQGNPVLLNRVEDMYAFNNKANLRAGPGIKYDVVSWAAKASQAAMLEHQGDWLRVQMLKSKRIGWVFHSSLRAVKTAVAVPTETFSHAPDALEGVVENTSPQVYFFKRSSDMRAGPGKAYDRIGQGEKNESAQEINHQGNWKYVRVMASGKQGWVFNSYLDRVRDTEPFHVVKQDAALVVAPSVASTQQKPVILNAVSDLYAFNNKANLRAGPGPKYDVVSWAAKASQATMLERQSDWLRVKMLKSKRIGWVFHSSLRAVKTAVAVSAETLPHAPNVVEHAAAQASHPIYFFKHTSDLRAGPGKSFDRVGWGGRNESAQEIAHQGDWTHVRMTISGKQGWVFHSYLERASGSVSYHIAKPDAALVAALDGPQTSRVYQVIRTEPLRSEAGDSAELIGSVSKGDMVTLLVEKDGWAKVSPHLLSGQVGWIETKLLRQGDLRSVEHKQAMISKQNEVEYNDRISKGKTFNYSYAAMDEALYRIPVEDMHMRIDKDDLKAIFLKRQYDQSAFDVRIKTGRHKLHGTVKVLGSSTRIFKKKSLYIKLDKESARWYGHRKIALRSMASDKALMREWMAWKMMAALGMKVPEVHFTRVSFNRGEKVGLYLSIEWMGPEFLEANGLDVRGEFYQPDDAGHCGDLYSTADLARCFSKITPQDEDYSNLKGMAISLNAATNSNIDKVLGRYFDVESVLNWIMVNSLLTNGDTYNKNYWLYYHPAEEKWTVIPWDYNLTFGRTYDQYGTRPFRIFNNNFQYYYPPDVGAGNPMKDKALRNPKLRAELETKIKHLIGLEPHGSEQTFGWFSPTVMHARVGNLATALGKELYKDTFLSYGEEDFTKTYESLMHYVTAHDYFLKTKLFGDFEWNPEPPNQGIVHMRLPDQLLASGEIAAGKESLHLIDRGWGYFVAHLDFDKPLESKAEFEVRIEGGITPKYLPTGQSARRCIERSWLLDSKTPGVSGSANVMFEYTQENSRRSEVPPSIHEELLELWMLDENHWKPIQTVVNEYSNTLVAKNITIVSGHEYRFVACSPF